MRQYAGFATAEETNRRYRYLLEQGQTGLSVAFDLPTQMGYDSDAPMAAGEVGRVGVPIGSLADMEMLFDGLPLDDVSTSMTINATASILLALYVGGRREAGRAARPDLGHDPERHPQGVHRPGHVDLPAAALDAPRDRRLRVLRDGAAALEHDLHQRLPHARGGRIGRAGARRSPSPTPSRTCEAALARGLAIDDFAPRLSFFFAAWWELFEEVAKFRAARRMWARIMRERFGATSERSMALPVPRPDRRLDADRPVDRQQRGQDHGPGAVGGARRCPEPPHERTRRGARAADRRERPGSRFGPSRSSPTSSG